MHSLWADWTSQQLVSHLAAYQPAVQLQPIIITVAPLAVPIRNNFTTPPTCHPPAAWRSACRTAAPAAASCPSSASTSASAGLEAQAPMGSRRGLGWALGGACLQRTAGNGAVSTGEHRSAARP